MHISEFDFELPEELIAQEAAPRGSTRLLVLHRASGTIEHRAVADLPDVLDPADLLVVNDTRVFAARLLGRRVPSGGAVECLLLSLPALDPGGRSAEGEALVHPGQKLKPGARVRFEGQAGVLEAEILERRFFGRRRIRFAAVSGGDVHALLDGLGHVPLPPYIRRPAADADRERYQTVYAAAPGSVAAPTAGLHFTPGILDALDRRGIERVAITLHVGYGTFKPVRADRIEDHVVDPEPYTIHAAVADRLNAARARGRRIVAVGTTTTRALEDASRDGPIAAGSREASLFIRPGYRFRTVGALMTNFHLPRSSLLMLTAAFGGTDRVLAAYRAAVAARYRFYSYGDAMVVV